MLNWTNKQPLAKIKWRWGVKQTSGEGEDFLPDVWLPPSPLSSKQNVRETNVNTKVLNYINWRGRSDGVMGLHGAAASKDVLQRRSQVHKALFLNWTNGRLFSEQTFSGLLVGNNKKRRPFLPSHTHTHSTWPKRITVQGPDRSGLWQRD